MRCMECLVEMEATNRPEKSFCCNAHKDAFNNRRKNRGVMLYDLFMALRFDRKEASLLKVYAILCRMASEWNEEDKKAGRKSFLPARQIVQRYTQFRAQQFHGISKRGR